MSDPLWPADLPPGYIETLLQMSDDKWRKLYIQEWPPEPPESPEEAYRREQRELRQAEHDRRWERRYGPYRRSYGRH